MSPSPRPVRDITAEDFRTVRAAIERVASRPGKTPTICRKCYIHPEVLSAYAEGKPMLEMCGDVAEDDLRPEEAAVLAWLDGRLSS